MKKVILLLLFIPYLASAQVLFDFESGLSDSWIQYPQQRWKDDIFQALNGSYSLHHVFDNPENGCDIVSTQLDGLKPSEGIVRWTFRVRHGYEPSSSNNWCVYLSSQSSFPEAGQARMNGFAIGVNISGSDDSLRLVRIFNGEVTTVCRTKINWQTGIGIESYGKIIVERTPSGLWKVIVHDKLDNILSETSGSSGFIGDQHYLGIVYRYTATKDQLLWIDDISVEGTFRADITAPSIIDYSIVSRKTVKIVFDEQPAGILLPDNFLLNGTIKPDEVKQIGSQGFVLEFSNGFMNKKDNYLEVMKICDAVGNCSDTLEVNFSPAWAERGDVIITEIMADPSPDVSLPEVEYLEIKNRSSYGFDLKDWNLNCANRSYAFPDRIIEPGEYLILCSNSDVQALSVYGKVAGFSTFPALNDDGSLIYITDDSGMLVHGVGYSSDWYGNVLKENGGWSLEIRSEDFPFSGEGNWSATNSQSGGTPGQRSWSPAKYVDEQFHGIDNVYAIDSVTIFVSFTEPAFNFIDFPDQVWIDQVEVMECRNADVLYCSFILTLNTALRKDKAHTLQLPVVTDFSGNPSARCSFIFGLTEKCRVGDILFNEIMFNPIGDDPDYIELFNTSQRILDASWLQLVSINDDTSDTSSIFRLSEEPRCIMPGQYFTVTPSTGKVTSRYFSSRKENIYIASLPSMPDNKGHIILLDRELNKIDEMIYSEKMHSMLLSGHEGIALEKAGTSMPSSGSANWHSAAENAGWGTPGAPNSVYSSFQPGNEALSFSSTRITPDNDGYEDFLKVDLIMPGIQNVVSFSVFDESGNLIRKLASNLLSGHELSLLWDGTASDGTLVRTGMYIMHITMYDEEGRREQWKKVCTVIR